MAELFNIDGETAVSPYGFTSVQIDAGNAFSPTEASAHVGAHGFSVVAAAADQACGRMVFAGQATLYCRIYVYVPSTFALETATAKASFIGFYNGGTYDCGIANASGTAPDRWYIRANGTSTYALFSSYPCLDAWHCLELYYIKAADVGGIALYYDGDVILSDLNQTTSGDIVQVDIGNLDLGDNSTGTIYIDDIVGATTYIGPIAAGGSIVPQAMRHYIEQSQ